MDYREYLKDKLETFGGDLMFVMEIRASMIPGNDPNFVSDSMDIRAVLAAYRSMVKVHAVLEDYNKAFDQENTRVLQRDIEMHLNRLEDEIVERIESGLE